MHPERASAHHLMCVLARPLAYNHPHVEACSTVDAPPPTDILSNRLRAPRRRPAGCADILEDVVIDGIVTGTIDMPANALTIGPKAQVEAKVFARDVTVYGTVSGKMTATEIVDIRDSARISGELAAPSVKLAEGARVNARVETKRVDAAVHVARYRMARNAR
jgi:cytoskeletal protein CcmA (bactofilin family)